MDGVVNGVYYCQMERTEQLNDRLYERNVPSGPLEPAFSIRPINTKYTILPIFDNRVHSRVPIIKHNYNIEKTFNPGNAQAPWNGFAEQINVESSLRNQFFALQKCEQSNFVPSSSSDLYSVSIPSKKVDQPFPLLFKPCEFSNFNPNNCNIGEDKFNNSTRVQIKNLQK